MILPADIQPEEPDWALVFESIDSEAEAEAKDSSDQNDKSEVPSTLPFPLISLPEAQRRDRQLRKSATDLERIQAASPWNSKPLPSLPPPSDQFVSLADEIQAKYPWLAARMQDVEMELAAARQQREDIKQMLRMEEPIRMAALRALDRKFHKEFMDKDELSVAAIQTVASITPDDSGSDSADASPDTSSMESAPLTAPASPDDDGWAKLEKQIEEQHANVRLAEQILHRMKSRFPVDSDSADRKPECCLELEIQKFGDCLTRKHVRCPDKTIDEIINSAGDGRKPIQPPGQDD